MANESKVWIKKVDSVAMVVLRVVENGISKMKTVRNYEIGNDMNAKYGRKNCEAFARELAKKENAEFLGWI